MKFGDFRRNFGQEAAAKQAEEVAQAALPLARHTLYRRGPQRLGARARGGFEDAQDAQRPEDCPKNSV